MQLIKIYSNKKSFKTVEFNKTGLNFIVAKQENPNSKDISKTYNGVGKSLLVRIIHFCMGASIKKYRSFCEELSGWEFYIDFLHNGEVNTIKRVTSNPNKIFFNGEEMTINKFNKMMGKILFDIPLNVDYLSFRSLLPFFIRKNKLSYNSFDEPSKVFKKYQTIVYNSFLLGLDVFLAQQKYELKREKDRIEKLEKNFKNDELLKDFFVGKKDVDLTIVDLEEKIKSLENDIKNFKVADDYYDVQKEADSIEEKLFNLNNEIILLKNNLKTAIRGLDLKAGENKENILKIYEEASIEFNKNIQKKLTDLERFYEKLISNRKKRLLEQKNKYEYRIKEKTKKANRLKKELDETMKYLGDHQALDVFVTISDKKSKLKSKLDSLKKYQELEQDYKDKIREIKKSLLDQSEMTELYLDEMKSSINSLRDYFRNLANRFYPNAVAGLSIKNNEGINQLRYDIDAKIESDNSDGINSVKIFCYDMTVLFKGENHNIDFIFHDSRLLDGVDERQKTEIFKVIYDEFSGSGKQYIATVNQNQLYEIKKYLDAETYNKIVSENIVLTLTDKDDSDKLLGITVDLSES